MVERGVPVARVLVVKHGMPLGEGAALAILAGQADRRAFVGQAPRASASAVAQSIPSPEVKEALLASRNRRMVGWTLKSSGTEVIRSPIKRSLSTPTPVRPASSRSVLVDWRPVQRPSSQSALFGR